MGRRRRRRRAEVVHLVGRRSSHFIVGIGTVRWRVIGWRLILKHLESLEYEGELGYPGGLEGGREDRESEGRKEGSTDRFWDVTFVLHSWRD